MYSKIKESKLSSLSSIEDYDSSMTLSLEHKKEKKERRVQRRKQIQNKAIRSTL